MGTVTFGGEPLLKLVAQVQAAQPDLILTGIKMPDMDGIEVAAQVNRQRPVPVSAHHDTQLA